MLSITRDARRWGRALLDALLPPQCLGCDAPVQAGAPFCATCFARVTFITEPCCTACGLPFIHADPLGNKPGTPRLCSACDDARPPWAQARAALLYDVQIRPIILKMKHGDRPELAAPLGGMMARAGASLLSQAQLLVPVPLHPARLRARRYNQAVLLAAAVSRLSHIPVLSDALVRTRPTQPLGTLSAERRQAAVEGVFAIRRGKTPSLEGAAVILIDDVLTSGATAAACTRALHAAGAARVDLLVAARVPDPRHT